METATFLYHNNLAAAAEALEQFERRVRKPIFDPEDAVEYDCARFIATFLPIDDWWLLGVARPSEDQTEHRQRCAVLRKLTEEYKETTVKSRGVAAAWALGAKAGVYIDNDDDAGSEEEESLDADAPDTEDESPEGIEAMMEPVAPMPSLYVEPAGDRLYAHQSYLHAAPFGINASAAWQTYGSGGSTVAFGLVDEGWNENHIDLKDKDYEIRGLVNPEAIGHGTGVLGIVCATDHEAPSYPPPPPPPYRRGEDAIGIAPGVRDIVLSSYVAEVGPPTPTASHAILRGSRAKAIAWAGLQLWWRAKERPPKQRYGDVLLIEAQTRYKNLLLPVEIDLISYIAIRAAVAAGIIVIEPGGNGSVDGEGHVDFDDFLLYRWCRRTNRKRIEFPLAPNRAGFRDSGAIIVSSVNQDVPHRRLFFAPIGNRIDVWAPGEQVTTCDSYLTYAAGARDGVPTDDTYQAGFAGTSASAAIIAGVVASIQSIRDAKDVRRLWPEEMRELLKERGTVCFDDRTNFVVGRMPDMKKLLRPRCMSRFGRRVVLPPDSLITCG